MIRKLIESWFELQVESSRRVFELKEENERLKSELAKTKDVCDIWMNAAKSLTEELEAWKLDVLVSLAGTITSTLSSEQQKTVINVNDKVKVILTTAGEARYAKYRSESHRGFLPDSHPADEDGKRSFQLWELMQIFGSTCAMGIDTSFIANAIEL